LIRLNREITGRRRNNTESLSGRGLHDPPFLNLFDSFCADAFEAPNFGFDIVSFDVQMHAARMIYALHLQVV